MTSSKFQELHNVVAKHVPTFNEEKRNAFLAELLAALGGDVTALPGVSASAADRATTLSPIECAEQNSNHVVLLKSVRARAKRLGYDIKDDKPVDTFALDRALSGKPIEERMRLKSDMALLGLIPA